MQHEYSTLSSAGLYEEYMVARGTTGVAIQKASHGLAQ